MLSRRTLRLAAIGTLAGAFSALFGVGGGAVIVPLLVLWLDFDARVASGTSLAAIVVIASISTAVQGAYGNVDVANGLLIGIPAVVGVVVGAELQQRVPTRVISLIFAGVLTVVAIDLLV